MLTELLKKFDALPSEAQNILLDPQKNKLVLELKNEYKIPLSLLLLQLLTSEISPEEFRETFKEEILDPSKKENLLYTLEANFLRPFEEWHGKKRLLHDEIHFGQKELQAISVFGQRQEKSSPRKYYDFGRLAEVVMDQFFLSSQKEEWKNLREDPILLKRLKNILVSYLKDIRNELETKHTLKRFKKTGGMGFQEEDAEKIFSHVQAERDNLSSYVQEVILEDQNVVKEPSISKEIQQISKDIKAESKRDILPPPLPMIVKPLIIKPQKEIITKKTVIQKENKKNIFQHKEKILKKEIEFTPRLVGPFEELRNLTLLDFRRLDSNSKKATEKIQKRINLLLEDSFEKRMTGIRAWQGSPLFQNYLFLGQESIKKGKNIEELIREHLEAGQETLTKDEFDAIMDLNDTFRV